MRESIKKIVLRLFPELRGGLHLPMFARVLAVSDPLDDVTLSDPFRPKYAVDIMMLDAQGSDTQSFDAVPVALAGAGEGSGLFNLPQRGAIVEVAFAYGLPSQPFVRQTLGTWTGMPELQPEEAVLQTAPGVYQKATKAGDWQRRSTGKIDDISLSRAIEAITNLEQYTRTRIETEGNSTEIVAGIKLIEALGALKLLSGGSLNLTAVDNLNLTTASDSNTTVGRNHNEAIEGIRTSLAKLKQITKVANGGTIWQGNDTTNTLQILSDLTQVVADIANTAATHKHTGVSTGSGTSGAPDIASQFSSQKTTANNLKTTLDPLVE